MIARWVDPNVRSSLALGAILLCVAGLVLLGRGPVRPGGPDAHPLIGSLLSLGSDDTRQDDYRTSSSRFSERGLRGRFALSHPKLLASGRRQLHAEFSVQSDDELTPARHEPISFVLVLDTSGSMAGRKLVDARNAVLSLFDQIHADDKVALVSFASRAEVLVPLVQASRGRRRVREALDRTQAVGSTDIAGALSTAASLLSSGPERTQRIVLVTDGRDTSGAPRNSASRLALRQADRGVTVSALGIGADYDDAYLGDLADAGRGNYAFVSDTPALARFISRELDETARTTARRIVAHVTLPHGVQVLDVSGGTWTIHGNELRLTLGSLFGGDTRRAVVTLEAQTEEPGQTLEFRTWVEWDRVGDGEVQTQVARVLAQVVGDAASVEEALDHSVTASIASIQASELELAASRAFEKGDRARALELNRQSQALVARAAEAPAPAPVAARLRAQKRAYEGDAHAYRTKPKAAAAPAARSIGARERTNMDRMEVGY